jgi:hypothetical protein
MVNFPVDSAPFILETFGVDKGGQDKVSWITVNLSRDPIHAHEEFVLAVDVDGVLLPQDNEVFLQQVRNFIENELDLHVFSTCLPKTS